LGLNRLGLDDCETLCIEIVKHFISAGALPYSMSLASIEIETVCTLGGVCSSESIFKGKAREGKQSFKDPFRHIENLSQKRARSVAAHSEKSVLFRPHAEI